MADGEDDEEIVTLQSSDGQNYAVPTAAAFLSETIQHLKEDTGSSAVVPLPNVHSRTLSKVLEYCKQHVADKQPAAEGTGDKDAAPPDESAVDKSMEDWDKEFISVDEAVLYEIILAANYLNIKTPDEIRSYFKIENDFSPEEEEEVRRENQWAFE